MNQLQIYLLLLITCVRGYTCKHLPLHQTTTVQDLNETINHPQQQQQRISGVDCPHEFEHNCHFCHLINEQPTCGCREGFVKNDRNECVDIDECRNQEILKSCNFHCVNTLGSYFCQEELQSEQPSEYDEGEDDEDDEYDLEEYEDYREEIGENADNKETFDHHYNSEDDDYDDDNDYYDNENDKNPKISEKNNEDDNQNTSGEDMSTKLQITNYHHDEVEISQNRTDEKAKTADTIINKNEISKEVVDEDNLTNTKLETEETTTKFSNYNYNKEATKEEYETTENLNIVEVTTKSDDNYDNNDRNQPELEQEKEIDETTTDEITTEEETAEDQNNYADNEEENYWESNSNATGREESLVDNEIVTTKEEDYGDYEEDYEEELEDYSTAKAVVDSSLEKGTQNEVYEDTYDDNTEESYPLENNRESLEESTEKTFNVTEISVTELQLHIEEDSTTRAEEEEKQEDDEQAEGDNYYTEKSIVDLSLVEGTKSTVYENSYEDNLEESHTSENNNKLFETTTEKHFNITEISPAEEKLHMQEESTNKAKDDDDEVEGDSLRENEKNSVNYKNDISVMFTEKTLNEIEISTFGSPTIPSVEEAKIEDENQEIKVDTSDTLIENEDNYDIESHSLEDNILIPSIPISTSSTITETNITREEISKETEINENEEAEAESHSTSSDDNILIPSISTSTSSTITETNITREEIIKETEIDENEEAEDDEDSDNEQEETIHKFRETEGFEENTPIETSTKQTDIVTTSTTKAESINEIQIGEKDGQSHSEMKEATIDAFKEKDIPENDKNKTEPINVTESTKEEELEENGEYDDYDDYSTEDTDNEDEETAITTTESHEDRIVTCDPGFEAVFGECSDIDECLNNNGNCSQICKNSIGSYYCECNNGFYLDQNQRNCNEINPCSINNGGCSHSCLFGSDGNVFCSCPSGYILEHNKTCKIPDLCQENNGNCSHYCSIIDQKVHCSCPRGYHLENSTAICTKDDPCLLENGGCSHYCQNFNGEVKCMCPENYTLIEDRDCELIDPCLIDNGGCTHYCSNSNSTPICSCPDHYNLINGSRCVQVDPCLINNGGCSHQCQSDNGTVHCLCPDDYQLNDKQCIRINPCAIKNGGCSHVCETINGHVICKCPPQYELIDKTCFKINPCLVNNGGCSHICTNDNGIARCKCPFGYYISVNKCIKEENPCDRNNGGCSHYCQYKDGRKLCSCPSGYQMKLNKRTCKDINECRIDNGGCSHSCENLPGSFQCTCPAGYALDDKNTTCQDIDECLADNGDCEQKCNNLQGSYKCGCNHGYVLQPDGKSCKLEENKGCYTLLAPRYSTIRCNNHQNNNMMPIGTQCMVWCDPGFKLIGDYLLTCQQSNYWNFNLPKCTRIHQDSCPKLPQIDNGRLSPDYCNKAPIPVGKTCHLYCKKGYRAEFSKFMCTYNQNWQPSQHHLRCFKDPDLIENEIRCSDQIDFILPENQSYMFIKIPKPETDVDWDESVKSEPYWAKFLQATLPAGRTEIIFSIYDRDTNRNLTSCRTIINIVDKENPRVYNCPSNIEYTLYRGQNSQIIHWREPTFEDNVGVSNIYKSKEPGTRFGVGLHHINYVASDEAGNRAFCHFTINIQGSEGEFSNFLPINQGDLQHSRAILVCPQSSDNYNNKIPTKNDCYWRQVRMNNQFQGLRIPQHKIHSGSRLPSHLQRQHKYFDWYEKLV